MILKIQFDPDKAPARYPFPSRYQVGPFQLVNHARVFSREQLDPGTEFFLRNFPPLKESQVVIDLGCGNGALGLAAAATAQEAMIFSVDESFSAVWSARESFRENQFSNRGVFLAGDGLEDLASDELPDLLILDIRMRHGRNGKEIATRLKQNNATKDMPIILISANDDIVEAVEVSGADAFVPKPFNVKQLLEVVRQFVG